jgi:hypothetical protein
VAANPIHNCPAQDDPTKTAEKIRLTWPEIMDGLIEAAIRGNVRAFLLLREEAWGTPISGAKRNPTAITLEELISADEGVTLPRGQRSTRGKGDYE